MFHLLLLYQKSFLVELNRCWRWSKCKRKCIYMEQGLWFIFVTYFNVMHFFNVIIFRWRHFFRVIIFLWVALLIWFIKSSKFGEGFSNNELLWSFPSSFNCVKLLSLSVLAQQARKFVLLDKEVKGNIVLQYSKQYQDSSQFWRYL